ncbi:hypothetical protein K3495_g1747 [Podosphaera aphanis]|nr:hypothetical protein K3495_g1747 [Podosphaera aphanis]
MLSELIGFARGSSKKATELDSKVDTKYFHEPGGNNDLDHYDARFFTGVVSDEVRINSLEYLIRSYLTIFHELQIETWIAHGTLLGWWWNGKILPWDWDLDTQVTATTLTWLSENLNMTTHNYSFTEDDDGTLVSRQYLIDVNSKHVERVHGDGQNVIDARWIDVRNGLFVDITGLSETEPELHPDVWSCKNGHHYATRELFPLRLSIFEGVYAKVPFMFDLILTQEYSSHALNDTEYIGYEWSPEQNAWIKKETKESNTTSRR